MNKLPYSQKTQKLIDKLCRIAKRKSYVLKKKEAEEAILKTYDLFDLKRPSRVVWYTHVTNEFMGRTSSAYRASASASSAYSAYSASSAYRAYRAYMASIASSASSASRASIASSASSAYRAASRAYMTYGAYRAYRASIDVDFDCSVCNFQYLQNPEGDKPNENDRKYFEYSKLVIKAKELGVGYFCDHEDVLYLVPVPIIYCNEQRQFHSEKKPAISWGTHEELYLLEGVKFEKEWWEKIVKDKLTPDEVFAIDNAEHRRIAYKYMDKAKLTSLPDYKVLDEKVDSKGNVMKILSFTVQNMDVPIKMYNCVCPTTKREYFLGTDKDTCDEAKAGLYGLPEVEWVNEW